MELSQEFLINIALPLLVAILAAAAAVYSELNIRKRVLRDIEIYEKWEKRLPESKSLPIKENLEKQITRNINSMTGEAVGGILFFDALAYLSFTLSAWFIFSTLIQIGVFSLIDFSVAAPSLVVCILIIMGLIYASVKRLLRFISCYSLLQKQMASWRSQAYLTKKLSIIIEDFTNDNKKFFDDLKERNSIVIKTLDVIKDDIHLIDILELEEYIVLLKEEYAIQEDLVNRVKRMLEDYNSRVTESKKSLEEINEAKYSVMFTFRLKRYERAIIKACDLLSNSSDLLMDSISSNNDNDLFEKICQVETEIERRKDC